MMQLKNVARAMPVIAAMLLAGCNSVMPADGSRPIAATRASGAADATRGVGTDEAIQTLALPPVKPLTPNPEYARFPVYVGTLGGKRIEMKLGAKTDEASGVHGEYRLAGSAAVILVAGDHDGDTLEIEESNDGTHITGNWVGKFAADGTISGERMNADDSDPQPFDLKPAVAGVMLPPSPSGSSNDSTPESAAPQPAPSLEPAPRNAVGGVSNVTTGE